MRRLIFVIVVCAVLPATAQQPTARELFERARILEESNRSLDEAVALYGQVATQTDGELAATALLRVGLLQERLGRTGEAQRAFQTVVTRYGGFASLAREARARLARVEPAGQQPNGMSSRLVWTVPSAGVVYGSVSRDGRYVPYSDWRRGGDLFVYDLVSGTSREVPGNRSGDGFQFAEFGGTFSPDGTQLAYGWFNAQFYEIRVATLTPGASNPRVVFSNREMPRVSPDDWSPDGAWLALQLQREDKTAQIGLVNVRDGALRVLKSIDWRLSTKLVFSPGGKYLAYDLPTTDTSDRRDVFVLAVDGSHEIPAVVHPADDRVMGWSPDGKSLLFTSDRTGSNGLWALSLVDGKPHGTPQQVKADVSGTSMGLTSKGTLYTLVFHANYTGVIRSDIHVAGFDFAAGQFMATPRSVVQAFVGANNLPGWSPDGKSLAFVSTRRVERNNRVIVIQSQETGALRELPVALNIYGGGPGPRWSPDGLALAIQATDPKGRQGLFRIDVTSGEATPIALSTRGPVGGGEVFTNPMWAADGKRIYYSRFDTAGRSSAVVERDLSSGNEKEVFRRPSARSVTDVHLSPDGRFFAASDGDWFAGAPVEPGTNRQWSIVLVATEGGVPKELMRRESHGGGILMWAPDGRSVFMYSITNKSKWEREVWRVHIDGSQPQRLDLNVNFLGPLGNSDQRLHVHPDGTRVAFAVSEAAKPAEVWALENFLPAVSARR